MSSLEHTAVKTKFTYNQTWSLYNEIWPYPLPKFRDVARPILVVGNNAELWAIIAEVGPGFQTVPVRYGGHAISWMVFWLCSFSVTFWYSLSWAVLRSMHSAVDNEICAGRHNVFCSECWAKIVSPGQARPAPPTVATNTDRHYWISNVTNIDILREGIRLVITLKINGNKNFWLEAFQQ